MARVDWDRGSSIDTKGEIVRFRLGLAVLAISVPFLVQPVAAEAATGPCSRSAVRTLAGTVTSRIDGAAPGGRFQVGENTGAVNRLVRWQDSVPVALAVSAENAGVTAVNDDGQVVGYTWGGQSWRLRDSAFSTLPTPAGFAQSTPVGINASGQIAGTVRDADGWNARGVVWGADDQPRVLPAPAGYNEVRISGIDDSGIVVGTVIDFDIENANTRAQRAAYWLPDGTVTVLPASSPNAFSEASSVRNGVAAGVDDGKAVTWRLGAGSVGTSIAIASYVGSINSTGSVVLEGPLRLYQPGRGERDLPTTDLASGGSATGLTDTNQAYGTDGYTQSAVRWECS